MANFPTITYTNLKHKVDNGVSGGVVQSKDEAITLVFNNGIGTTNKYRASFNSPHNQITGTLSSNRELSKWQVRVTPIEVDDFGPEVGNRATLITGISANTATNFTIPITQAVFTGSSTNTYRLCLMGQSSLDYSWDCTQLYMVIDTNTSFTNTYTEVEYLESTLSTGQYINTNYILDFNTKIVSKNMPTYDGSFMFWGAKDDAKREYSAYYNGASNGLRPYFNTDGSHASQFYWGAMPINQVYEIEYDVKPTTQTFKLNGQTQTKTFNLSGAGTFGKPLLIFASSQYQATYAYYGPSRCYYLKVYNGSGTLVRDMVPCIRNSDNKPGMYDRVNNVFYTNQGSGEFTYGPLKSVPQTYQQVEYIANKDTTSDSYQYIDTNWIPNYSAGFKIDLDIGLTALGVRYCMLGSHSAGNNMLDTEITSSNYARLWLNSGSLDVSVGTCVLGRNRLLFSYLGSTWTIDCNGNTNTGTYTFTATDSNRYSLYMFIDRSKRYSTFPKSLLIYSCKIYDGGALVRNFVPCYRKSDNVIGMLDMVNNVFYTNAGSGTFTKGSNINNINYIKYKPTDYDGYDVHFVN